MVLYVCNICTGTCKTLPEELKTTLHMRVFFLQKDPVFQQVVILVSLEGLENKYGLELSRGRCLSNAASVN